MLHFLSTADQCPSTSLCNWVCVYACLNRILLTASTQRQISKGKVKCHESAHVPDYIATDYIM